MSGYSENPPDILVVDDTPANLRLLAGMLKDKGYRVRPVLDGRSALDAARRAAPTLILLDINMPELSGYEVCAALKADPLLRAIPVIFISANSDISDKVRAFAAGGVDYVTKPFHFEEVHARVEAHLRIQRLQLALDEHNSRLQEQVAAQVKEISDAQIAAILALAKLGECRDEDTGRHVVRVQRFCRALAQRLDADGVFGDLIDTAFIADLYHGSALHDVGKVAIPDSVLLKPGKLTAAELEVMKRHTVIGAEALAAVLDVYPTNTFLRMGAEIARHHHERWDGSGYPAGLAGEEIPLSARIVSLADQYDALRNRRPYKPPFSAARTFAIITGGDERSRPEHLDPRILTAFTAIAPELDAIFDNGADPTDGA